MGNRAMPCEAGSFEAASSASARAVARSAWPSRVRAAEYLTTPWGVTMRCRLVMSSRRRLSAGMRIEPEPMAFFMRANSSRLVLLLKLMQLSLCSPS